MNMKTQISRIALIMLLPIVVFTAGCASTKVVGKEDLVKGEKLPRPGAIWVYDFGTTSGEIPTNSALAGENLDGDTPPTVQQAELARELGYAIASRLSLEISQMGLSSRVGTRDSTPEVNDLVIHGYLLSVVEGSAGKRMVIGFGSGASELRTVVEVFQMTSNGLRKLGSGTIQSGSSKGPGGAVGLATFLATANPVGLIVSGSTKVAGEATGSATVQGRAKKTAEEIAKRLEIRFKNQGWID